MKLIIGAASLALTSLSMPFAAHAAPAAPASQPAIAVPGLAFANLDAVVANSAAFKAARAQRAVTFKPQIDQAEARRQQAIAQLQPLVVKFNKDRTAPNPNQAALSAQAQTIQQMDDGAKRDIQTILQPAQLSDAYVLEQINAKVPEAVQAAMAKHRVSVLLGPQNVLVAGDANNLNLAIIAELDAVLPAVQLVPPAGWQPKAARSGG